MVVTVVARPFAALACAALLGLAACTSDGDGVGTVSVFAVRPGECFSAPKSVKVQLATLSRKACSSAHTQEAYAVVDYAAPGTRTTSAAPVAVASLTSSYPGTDALTTFAQGVCAQRYAGYVGVDYLDSALFFTFLLPSARSWEQVADRKVICFVTTTGQTLSASVKGSKR